MEEHKTYTCNLCGAVHRREKLISFDGRLLCEDCRVPIRCSMGHCLAYCHGHVTPYCQACYMMRSREIAAIHDYFYKPAAIFPAIFRRGIGTRRRRGRQ